MAPVIHITVSVFGKLTEKLVIADPAQFRIIRVNHIRNFAGKEKDPVLPFPLEREMRAVLEEKLDHLGLDIHRQQIWETFPVTWLGFPDKDGVPLVVIGKVTDMVPA